MIKAQRLHKRDLGFVMADFFPSFGRWVKRDSYLPVGSQHLKAATKVTLLAFAVDKINSDPFSLSTHVEN